MLIILSPAKKLDISAWKRTLPVSSPELLPEAEKLVAILRESSPADIAGLMHLSQKLADLNYARYQSFHTPFTTENAKPAILTFAGDVYEGLQASSLSDQELVFAQTHLRILSGLYGVLQPLDLMQEYRLEMGTKLPTDRGKNLYEFWGDRITKLLNNALQTANAPALINLASQEYFKAVNVEALSAPLITTVFKERKGDKLKVIGLFAKKARGMMARYALTRQLTKPEALKKFSDGGYAFAPELSTETEWVFTR